jgi:hypothetical protein
MLACALALGAIAAAPVFAGCEADVKAAEEAAAKATDAKQRSEAQTHIDAARSELAKANEKACAEHVTAANAALKTKPELKTQ